MIPVARQKLRQRLIAFLKRPLRLPTEQRVGRVVREGDQRTAVFDLVQLDGQITALQYIRQVPGTPLRG